MGRKVLIILVMILVLIAGGAGGYVVFSLKNRNNLPVQIPTISQTISGEEVKADLTYTDDSGFSFGYPKSIRISDVTPDEEVYYSVLALAREGNQITITIKDTTVKTIDEWSRNESAGNLTLYGAATLGGVSAQQYTNGVKLYTTAIDQGVLYLIEGPKDGSFWEDAQNLVVSTFSFGTSSTSGETIYEEEEVVE
jgi:hypothetical protein